MRALLLIGRWFLVALGVLVWIVVVPLVDLVAGRFETGDEPNERGAPAQRAHDFARAA
jgi:hypothetical protein